MKDIYKGVGKLLKSMLRGGASLRKQGLKEILAERSLVTPPKGDK